MRWSEGRVGGGWDGVKGEKVERDRVSGHSMNVLYAQNDNT